ncbi:calcium-dependent phosphotriesterase [Panus rudis PR-1116 ss-1]|nr:calcium-dependent phosphotriesterase [Panus rudis PR-1116 ss-1]
MILASALLVVLSACAPSHAVIIDPLVISVLGQNATFRQNSFTEFFNPTNTSPPFFQVFHPDFISVLGKFPSIRSIASNPSFAFAHEAPIWLPHSDEVTFASNGGGALGRSGISKNNQVSMIDLKEVAKAIENASAITPVNVSVAKLDLPETVQMTNGGTGLFRSALLLVNSGRGPLPPSITLSNPNPPYNTTVLLDNFFGRQFNSLNDIKIHPKSKKLFFTDVSYGYVNHFRPAPLMPNQVYRFDPDTGVIRVVADGFEKPNGIAFSQCGSTAYITDTGVASQVIDQTKPATIYAFDVHPKTQAFHNRRVFAYVDTGLADGIQIDTQGNVYAGTGDGVHVWNNEGTLIGKFFLGTVSANMIFAGKGRLVILAETEVFLAEIAAEGFNLSFS